MTSRKWRARSAVILEPPADRLVHALKYQGWRELAPLMARRMRDLPLPPEALSAHPVVVPIPTTRRRERGRGYNQAALLGRGCAALLSIPFLEALERRPGAVSQVALRPSERRANVRDAFHLGPDARARVAGRHVLLADDVLTTGATACAAAETLERADASGVTVITFARAIPERQRGED